MNDYGITPEIAAFIKGKQRLRLTFTLMSCALIFSYPVNYLDIFTFMRGPIGNSFITGSLIHLILVIAGTMLLSLWYVNLTRKKFDAVEHTLNLSNETKAN